MASFDSLPPEILSQVLKHINSTRQLGEYRLVCKRWDSPAEGAMFSKKLIINKHNSESLYMHLSRTPSRANLIKEIHLGTGQFTDTMALLLRLAATPSLRKIAPVNYPDMYFYQTLAQIAKDSGMKLQHLKRIPWPAPGGFTETFYQTILLLKDSLEHITIPPSSDSNGPHEISKHLEEFKCLSSTLCMACRFQNLPQAESIFRGARKLKGILLYNCYIDQGNNWSSEERLHWMKQNVEINENVMAFRATDDSNLSISLIEYFLYKYPNMGQFDYSAAPPGSVAPNVEISTQACLWISKIPCFRLSLGREHRWKSDYILFAGYKNTVRLYYGGEPLTAVNETNMISSEIEQGQERSTRFQLAVDNIFNEAIFGAHVTFLEDIGAFTTSLYMIFRNIYISNIDNRHTFESKAFFAALKTMNHLDLMNFRSPGRLEGVELDLPSQYEKRRLETLEINVVEIQPTAFHTLDRLFHAINTLVLSYRYIEKDKTNTVCIHMPSTALETLFINAYMKYSSGSLDGQSDNQSKLFDTYVMLNLQQGVTLYFKVEPFNSNVHQVSFVDYSSRPRDSTAFSIHTRLIASIKLNLGRDIRANIDVQKYCKTLDAAFDELRLND